MNCGDLGETLVDGWDDRLSAARRAKLEEHLASCEDCREEAGNLEAIWLQLGALDAQIEVPSERLRWRFYAFPAEEQRRLGRPGLGRRAMTALAGFWPRRLRAQMALVAATLVLGVGLGLAAAGLGAGSEIRTLRRELASISGDVGVSLLTHPAATERLRGVGLTDRAPGDEEVVTALLEVVRNDPSVNVRLAAIEALALRIEQLGVKPRLLRTLPSQRSPLLQMTLLDVLLPTDGEEVLEVAAPLLEHDDLDAAVRQRLLDAKRGSV